MKIPYRQWTQSECREAEPRVKELQTQAMRSEADTGGGTETDFSITCRVDYGEIKPLR